MDRIEFYIDGFKFLTTTTNRSQTVFFANHKFKTTADLFETCLDIIEPDLEHQLVSVREKMRKSKGFPVIPELPKA